MSSGEEEEEYYDSSFEDSEVEDDSFIDDSVEVEDSSSSQLDVIEYNVLSSRDIRRRVDEEISEISTLLSLPAYAARLLLCKYGWNVSKVHEEWFSDETKTRENCGLTMVKSDDSVKDSGKKGEFFCGICLESYHQDSGVAAVCGHVFCGTCWTTYFSLSITDGMGSLSLLCPDPTCGVSIAYMADSCLSLSDEDKDKYENHVLRSYVESRKNIKWCPSAGCEFAVERLVGALMSAVKCGCSNTFCWNCGEEHHSPADCSAVGKWVVKNSSEAENTNWLLSNTKPCPKCRKSIEKNQGCMHMKCAPPCNYNFCWLCLGAWSTHGERTGGYYACNRYEKEKQEGRFDKAEKVRNMAKAHLVKYTHYYERWIGNHNSMVSAVKNLDEFSKTNMQKLMDMYQMTENGMQFAINALNQILECRRVLKWSYAFGFYLPEKEVAKKEFFEYLQGDAESSLERLHGLVESGLAKHIKEAEDKLESDEKESETQRFVLDEAFKHTREAADLGGFSKFKSEVLDLTTVTRNYFVNLVTAIANGLEDVEEGGRSRRRRRR